MDEENGNGDEGYVWLSSGGCEMCDSMDGEEFDTEPYRPHPNCNCTIVSRSGGGSDCDESLLTYQVDWTHSVHHTSGVDPNEEFDFIFDYEIHCPGGQEIAGEGLVSKNYGEYRWGDYEDVEADAYEEALELVDEIAASECPPCPDPPAVS